MCKMVFAVLFLVLAVIADREDSCKQRMTRIRHARIRHARIRHLIVVGALLGFLARPFRNMSLSSFLRSLR